MVYGMDDLLVRRQLQCTTRSSGASEVTGSYTRDDLISAVVRALCPWSSLGQSYVATTPLGS